MAKRTYYFRTLGDAPEGGSAGPREGPFSALTPSMWPSASQLRRAAAADAKATAPSDGGAKSIDDPVEAADPNDYDEFGFRIEREDGPEQSSHK